MPDLHLPLAELLSRSPGPYIALMMIGFAVAIVGHLSRARLLVAVGVALIALGTFLFPLVINLTTKDRPPPVKETPR